MRGSACWERTRCRTTVAHPRKASAKLLALEWRVPVDGNGSVHVRFCAIISGMRFCRRTLVLVFALAPCRLHASIFTLDEVFVEEPYRERDSKVLNIVALTDRPNNPIAPHITALWPDLVKGSPR